MNHSGLGVFWFGFSSLLAWEEGGSICVTQGVESGRRPWRLEGHVQLVRSNGRKGAVVQIALSFRALHESGYLQTLLSHVAQAHD